MTCASRGCHNEAPPRFTRCVDCLMGGPQRRKFAAQVAAVRALPPLLVAAGTWTVRVPGRPLSWNNALVRPKGGRRPFLSAEAKEWKEAVGAHARVTRPAGWPLDARYVVEVRSTFARSSSDADGPIKLALDALKGIAWNDDKQVVQVTATKDVDPLAPRLDLVIRVVA